MYVCIHTYIHTYMHIMHTYCRFIKLMYNANIVNISSMYSTSYVLMIIKSVSVDRRYFFHYDGGDVFFFSVDWLYVSVHWLTSYSRYIIYVVQDFVLM